MLILPPQTWRIDDRVGEVEKETGAQRFLPPLPPPLSHQGSYTLEPPTSVAPSSPWGTVPSHH